jgi:hypothetical protein
MLLQMMSDPVQAVEIMIYCSIAIQSLSVGVLWRQCDWRKVIVFLSGGILGLPFGVWLLLHLEHDWFKQAVGMLLIVYATTRLVKWRFAIAADNGIVDACVGFLGGITGGLAGFPGASVTIWCGMKGWDKRRQRGIFQPFILIMQILALLLLQVMRPSAGRSTALELLPFEFVPVALLGTWFGLVIFRRLSDRSFDLAVNLLLVVSGVGLVA